MQTPAWAPGQPDRTSGYRHRLVLPALGVDEALRSGDPHRAAVQRPFPR
jgi:hypothetical protein